LFDFKTAPQTSGYQYSNLSVEELKTIADAEQKLSKSHNSNQVLIAYDQAGGTGQSGAGL
jgi:hypothetical protein